MEGQTKQGYIRSYLFLLKEEAPPEEEDGSGGGKNGKRGRSGGFKPKCYNCGKRGHIARDCTEGDGDDDDSELDDATLRKAAKQLRKKARARHANVTIPGC